MQWYNYTKSGFHHDELPIPPVKYTIRIWKTLHKSKASEKMCLIYTLIKGAKELTLLCLRALLRKVRRDNPHNNKAMSFATFLMCKSYRLYHLPYFCMEPFIYAIRDTAKCTIKYQIWGLCSRFFAICPIYNIISMVLIAV